MRRNLYKITHNQNLHVGVNKFNFSCRRHDTASRRQSLHGFTLIELLVVIAIIALLLAIIMPSLNAAKRMAQGVVCLANLNGLSKAWVFYADENNDELVGANTTSTAYPYFSWVDAPQDDAGNPVDVYAGSTVDEETNGIKKGLLFSYLETADVYHCPGDKRSLKPPASSGFGGVGGYRTYSIGGGLRYGDFTGSNPYVSATFGTEAHTKRSTIRSPGSKFAFIEEADGRGINMGSWVTDPTVPESWIDPVAIWHVDSSTFGFADGHGERHKWHQKEILEMAEVQTYYWPARIIPGEDTDFIRSAYPYLKTYP
jgi:prepilin-type N-terminal cleavage/methylation domain-containing protein